MQPRHGTSVRDGKCDFEVVSGAAGNGARSRVGIFEPLRHVENPRPQTPNPSPEPQTPNPTSLTFDPKT